MTRDELEARRAWRKARLAELRKELRELLDEEAQDLSLQTPASLDALRDECLGLIRAGKMPAAVLLYRNRTGLSLGESRDALLSLRA